MVMKKMSLKEYKQYMGSIAPGGKKKNKFNAKRVDDHTGKFDSKGERNYYLKLKRLEMAGLVRDIKRQIRFDIVVNGKKICRYTADFSFYDVEQGCERVVDFKGAYKVPRDVKIRIKLVSAVFGVDVEIVNK